MEEIKHVENYDMWTNSKWQVYENKFTKLNYRYPYAYHKYNISPEEIIEISELIKNFIEEKYGDFQKYINQYDFNDDDDIRWEILVNKNITAEYFGREITKLLTDAGYLNENRFNQNWKKDSGCFEERTQND